MMNAPKTTITTGIKCSICRADIKDRHQMYQISLKLGVICSTCRCRFSDEDIEMILNLFFAFGGYFGKFNKSEFSIDDVIVEFADQLNAGNTTLHSQNIKMWHRILTYGITPEEFLRELRECVELKQ